MFECLRNRWTRIDVGSFNGVRRTYLLRSSTGIDFTWRWRGSFLPFQRKGKSSGGEARAKLPPISVIWILRVKPEEDTFISVEVE